eukprot:ctg_1327.g431
MTTPPGSTPSGKGDASSSRTVQITTAMRAGERSGKERTADGKTVSRASGGRIRQVKAEVTATVDVVAALHRSSHGRRQHAVVAPTTLRNTAAALAPDSGTCSSRGHSRPCIPPAHGTSGHSPVDRLKRSPPPPPPRRRRP